VLKQWLAEARVLVAGERFDAATAELTTSVSANDYIQSARSRLCSFRSMRPSSWW
jgi:hypothetical protein